MENSNSQPKNKKRSLTELTLGWIAEKMRKSEEIKKKITEGTYQVDSNKLAQSLIKPDS